MNLEQDDVRDAFESLGTHAWTTVCDSWSERDVANGGIYCALAPKSERKAALGGTSWNIRKGSARPGFSQRYVGGKEVTTYESGRNQDSFEPLVLLRIYHGVVPEALELVEEFRLYHNLYWDDLTSQYMKP